jgi:hypothetical protein
MQRDDRRKRTIAGGPVQISLQPKVALAEFDRLGGGGSRDAECRKEEGRQAPCGTPDEMRNERV